jgi:hypothetical protein
MTDKQRERLMKYVEKNGVSKAALDIGIARNTLANVLAELNVHPGSMALVDRFLEGLR